MAYVKTMRGKGGNVTSYRVMWRKGGRRDGENKSERFLPTEEGLAAAELFCAAVNECGQECPPGWVEGAGHISNVTAAVERGYLFSNFAVEVIESWAGVAERYRDDCLRDVERYINPTFGNCDVRSVEHFNAKTVGAWVNQLAGTRVMRGSQHKLMALKTLRNLFVLLSAILQKAVDHEPPLRDRNPCKLVKMPKRDTRPMEDGVVKRDTDFLEPEEVRGVIDCLGRESDKRLARFLYATGLRWSEVTGLKHQDVDGSDPERRSVSVVREWNWSRKQGFFLAAPKTETSTREVRLSHGGWDCLEGQGVTGAVGRRGRLIFHNGHGKRLPYSSFYDRWMTAVALAKEAGTLPEWKTPAFHALRHSHASVLISEGESLILVSRRLGHASYQITVDLYTHLLRGSDDAAMVKIDKSLGWVAPEEVPSLGVPADVEEDTLLEPVGRRVYVLHLAGGVVQGFWRKGDRDLVAEQWILDHPGEADATRTETWAEAWWVRTQGDGVKHVRYSVPDRVWMWFMGPAVYRPDGTLLDPRGAQHEPVGRYVWEWEELFTGEAITERVVWREAPAVETEAEVRGYDRSEVVRAYSRACLIAQEMCRVHPGLAGPRGGEARVQTDS